MIKQENYCIFAPNCKIIRTKASKLRKKKDLNVNNNKIEALLQCIGNETKNRRQIQADMREVDGKRFGDWEMDTIVGKNNRSTIVTLTERSTNYMQMKHLKHGKNPKELAQDVKWLLFPYRHLVKTITTDNGTEFCDLRTISKALGATVYFTDSYSSWQKGRIENINKLIRQYVPKSTDFNTFTDEQLLQIQYKINRRPKKNCVIMTRKLASSKIFN